MARAPGSDHIQGGFGTDQIYGNLAQMSSLAVTTTLFRAGMGNDILNGPLATMISTEKGTTTR